MARYCLAYWLKHDHKKTEHRTQPVNHPSGAILPAGITYDKCRVITLLRDSEGADHPANAGKFFLDRIVK